MPGPRGIRAGRAYVELGVHDRIKAGLDKTTRVKRPNADIRWPNNAKPGKPGTMQVESEHFIWISGSQAGSEGDPWVNAKAPDRAQWYRDGSIQCAEYWWALNEYAGNLMPYWDRKFFKLCTVNGVCEVWSPEPSSPTTRP